MGTSHYVKKNHVLRTSEHHDTISTRITKLGEDYSALRLTQTGFWFADRRHCMSIAGKPPGVQPRSAVSTHRQPWRLSVPSSRGRRRSRNGWNGSTGMATGTARSPRLPRMMTSSFASSCLIT
jgi:hypothetical protein